MKKIKIKTLERILKALANKRRLTIIKYLKKRDVANVGDIADHIKLSFKATSKHLSILTATDITEREQQGLNVNYQLSKQLNHVVKHISNSFE
jgi:DNA-binding transcriptional ArsR family regulator